MTQKNEYNNLTENRNTTANMRLASCGVKCINSSAVFQINFSAGLTVLCPEIPHERQAQNRYSQFQMTSKTIILFLLIFSANLLKGQNLNEFEDLFLLIKSGKKKVVITSNDAWGQLWLVDSGKYTIEKYSFMEHNGVAPKFDEKRTINTFKKYYFTKVGRIDSILYIHYPDIVLTLPDILDTSKTDTSIFVFTYDIGKTTPYNCKHYSLKSGKRIIHETELYGYDRNGRLIMFFEDEGRIQYRYLYNLLGQLEEEQIQETIIKYYYDATGKKIKKTCGTQITTFQYNSDQLIESWVLKDGKKPDSWGKFAYE